MIGHYISAFVIFIIFIDDWDLSENNTDHLATPLQPRLSIRHPPPQAPPPPAPPPPVPPPPAPPPPAPPRPAPPPPAYK